MSRRKCPDVKDLKRMVVRLGVEMRSTMPTVPKAEFLLALYERFDDQITPEQQRYCLDQWSWPVARKAMQTVEAETEGMVKERQLMLPMSMKHIKVPRALPIVIKGVPETVTAVFANDAEWYSFSVNATHGYPRDKDDVGRILCWIFDDPEWSHVPLGEISRHTAIPWATVQRRHSKLASGQVGQIKPVEREVTRGGSTYTMNTTAQVSPRPLRNLVEDIPDRRRPGQRCGDPTRAIRRSGAATTGSANTCAGTTRHSRKRSRPWRRSGAGRRRSQWRRYPCGTASMTVRRGYTSSHTAPKRRRQCGDGSDSNTHRTDPP